MCQFHRFLLDKQKTGSAMATGLCSDLQPITKPIFDFPDYSTDFLIIQLVNIHLPILRLPTLPMNLPPALAPPMKPIHHHCIPLSQADQQSCSPIPDDNPTDQPITLAAA
jgi:hypothetical protein